MGKGFGVRWRAWGEIGAEGHLRPTKEKNTTTMARFNHERGGRRWRKWTVSDQCWLGMVTTSAPFQVLEGHLPKDVKVIAVERYGGEAATVFILESDSWPAVQPGQPIPEVEPMTIRVLA